MTMNDLTAQYKAGKLADGWYWVKTKTYKDTTETIKYARNGVFNCESFQRTTIVQVLAKVPDAQTCINLQS